MAIPGLVIPVVVGLPAVPPGVPVVPPVATNAAFLTVYAQISTPARNVLEYQVWAELAQVSTLAHRVHNFGEFYIHDLNRGNYAALSLPLQDAIALNAWNAAGGMAIAPPAVMIQFVNNMLP